MITRRSLLASAVLAMSAAPSFAKAKLGEDGLYQEDWYVESFLDLAEDLTNANQAGKRFTILWGLRNCPACRRMHQVHLADPAIETYIRDNFAVLHLNVLGAREVTDFGGSKLTEKALAKHYGIEGTPAIQFFPTSAAGLAAKPPREREVARMASLLEPQAFIAQFRAVRNGV
jgi:thioredoxin-related protein